MFTVFGFTMGPMTEEWLPDQRAFNNPYFCEGITPRLTSIVFSWLWNMVRTTSLSASGQFHTSQLKKVIPMHERQPVQKDASSNNFTGYCTK
jgi:hypothetical protein